MNNKYDEIKRLLKSSRDLLGGKQSINENIEIKKKYGIHEYDISKKIDVGAAIENEIRQDKEPKNEDEKIVGYRILNGVMFVIGQSDAELILTEDEKSAFKQTMNEFYEEVSDAVDYGPLILYPKNVIWSGYLTKVGIQFLYNLMDDVYISSTPGELEDYKKLGIQAFNQEDMVSKPMIKLEDEFEETIKKLKAYFQNFSSKWNDVIGNRKETKAPTIKNPMGMNKINNGYETFEG